MQLLKCFKKELKFQLSFGESDQHEGNADKCTKNFDWKRPSKWERNCSETNKKANSWRSLGTLAAIGIPMAIELASKIFGSGLQTPRKAGGKGLQTPRKAGTGLQVSQKPFLWQPPPSMVHGRGRDAERREKDFYWGTTAHSTTSPSWEQFFRGEAKMERYSPV